MMPVAIAVAGMLGFEPRSSPDLAELEAGLLGEERNGALAKTVHRMAEDFTYNQRQIAWKRDLLRVSIILVSVGSCRYRWQSNILAR